MQKSKAQTSYRHLKSSRPTKLDSILRVTKSGSVIFKSQVNHRKAKPKSNKILPTRNIDAVRLAVRSKDVVLPKPEIYITPEFARNKFFDKILWQNFFVTQRVSIAAAVVGLCLTFGLGSWLTLHTIQTNADSNPEPQVLGTQTPAPPGSMLLEGVSVSNASSASVQNGVLFNTPIQYLQSYLAASNQPDALELRTQKISQFLKDMNSPFVKASDTIAKQDHWKLILAIAFAESTLGKNCWDNNCSNIGVGPSSSHWRKYASYSEWVIDFNSLLERRYKDWTLEQMCGVYVQPCNDNWLLATKQILDKIEERDIQ